MARAAQTPGIKPRLTLGRRLDIAARWGFPGGLTLGLMLLTQVPLRILHQAVLLPAVAVICVWFWSVHRPAAVPPPLVFLFGLLLDLIGYLPLGVGVLTLLITHGVAYSIGEALTRQRFAVAWTVFAVVAAGGAALIWLLTALLTVRLLSPIPALFQAVVSVALYPVLSISLARAHRSLADPDLA